MTARVARLACVALVLALLIGGAATPTSAAARPTDTIAQTGINPDDVSMRITLRENGDAAWAIDYRVRLDTNETTDAFVSLRDDVRENESRYASQFRDRMASTAASAENSTGREMAIRNVSVSATRQQLPQDYGIVTYTFVWTNFSAVDDGTIRAGDALAGLFLDSETSIQFAWPAGHGLESVRPEPSDLREESRIAVWSGPLDFGPDEPALVVSEDSAAGAGTTTKPAGGPGEGDSGGLDPLLLGGFVVLVAAAAAVGWYLYRRRGPSDSPDAPAPEPTGESGGSASAAEGGDAPPVGDAGPHESAADADAGTTAEASETGATGTDAESGEIEADAADAEPPWEDELLSNEERVLALVEHEGGRMKQQEVAQTLDWTDAKTSQVVRKMRDEGDLDAFRLGRENVLVLPDEEFGPGAEGDE